MPLQMAEWRGRHMDPWPGSRARGSVARDSRVEVGKRWVRDYDKALQRLAETRLPEAVAALRGDALLPTQVITTLARAAHWSLAVAFYSEMARSCLEMTVYHASAAVKACQQAGAWEPALALLEGAPSLAVQPNDYTYNAAISACEKRGRWQEAAAIFGLMAQRQCLLSVISFSAAMSACEKANRWQEALYLLHSMAGASVAKNTIAFSAAISACEKGGEWLLALELLTQMTLESVQRNTVTYCAAISACEKAAQWEAALQLFWEMPQRGRHRGRDQLQRGDQRVREEWAMGECCGASAHHVPGDAGEHSGRQRRSHRVRGPVPVAGGAAPLLRHQGGPDPGERGHLCSGEGQPMASGDADSRRL
ncbi:unnamed protein product [Effrenium voratum]|nr:unnamed protein product [Effrenium voratum]